MEISLLHRREGLIYTAIEVMNELGIQGLSTREIAKRQGVSEATLFRHYKNKSELLQAVLAFYSQYDGDIYQSIKLKQLEPKEAIVYFVDAYATYYQNYPAITVISQAYDILSLDPELAETIKEIFFNRRKNITELIQVAQAAGTISSQYDAELLADMIMGAIREICLRWRLSGHYFSLRDETMRAVQIILKAMA